MGPAQGNGHPSRGGAFTLRPSSVRVARTYSAAPNPLTISSTASFTLSGRSGPGPAKTGTVFRRLDPSPVRPTITAIAFRKFKCIENRGEAYHDKQTDAPAFNGIT